MESMKHVRKLAVMLLDLPQQVLAQKRLLEASDFVVLLEGSLDPVQFTKVR